MNQEFEECLGKGKIRKFPSGGALAPKELETAEEDLKDAEESFSSGKYKWSTIQAYYSMFHSARALLYAKDYRERSHHCLIAALRVLYVDTRLVPGSLIEALGKGKRLREDADYYNRWSQEGAEFALEAARDFLSRAQDLTKER